MAELKALLGLGGADGLATANVSTDERAAADVAEQRRDATAAGPGREPSGDGANAKQLESGDSPLANGQAYASQGSGDDDGGGDAMQRTTKDDAAGKARGMTSTGIAVGTGLRGGTLTSNSGNTNVHHGGDMPTDDGGAEPQGMDAGAAIFGCQKTSGNGALGSGSGICGGTNDGRDTRPRDLSVGASMDVGLKATGTNAFALGRRLPSDDIEAHAPRGHVRPRDSVVIAACNSTMGGTPGGFTAMDTLGGDDAGAWRGSSFHGGTMVSPHGGGCW